MGKYTNLRKILILRKIMRKLELKTTVSAVLAIIAGAVPLIIVPPLGIHLYGARKPMTIEVLVRLLLLYACARTHYRVFYRKPKISLRP